MKYTGVYTEQELHFSFLPLPFGCFSTSTSLSFLTSSVPRALWVCYKGCNCLPVLTHRRNVSTALSDFSFNIEYLDLSRNPLTELPPLGSFGALWVWSEKRELHYVCGQLNFHQLPKFTEAEPAHCPGRKTSFWAWSPSQSLSWRMTTSLSWKARESEPGPSGEAGFQRLCHPACQVQSSDQQRGECGAGGLLWS